MLTHTPFEKCTDDIKVHLGDTLKADLKVMAANAGHDKLSTYIRKVLQHHAYGHAGTNRDVLAGSVRDE